MCGRVALARPLDALAHLLDARLAPGLAESWVPSWNVAPSRPLVGVAPARGGERLLQPYRWGFVIATAASPAAGHPLFNARAETVTTSPAFRAAARERRLVVPVDGFYEWQGEGSRRRPFFFQRADGLPLLLAGLWQEWRGQLTCTIVTTPAGPDLDGVHDRMPAVLEGADVARWLAPARPPMVELLRPAPAGTLTHHPVDRRVGDVRNDDPGLVAPARPEDEPPEPLRLFG